MEQESFFYHTIGQEGESLYREKGSRFIGKAFAVHSEQQAKELLAQQRHEHPDAVHVCWAYLLKKDRNDGRCSDDGEPSGTAGKPILNQIYSTGIQDALVMVIRYYGGIKLGTSGLIQAYKTAAKEALANAKLIEIEEHRNILIRFPFSLEGKVQSLIKKNRLEIVQKEFSSACTLDLRVPLSVYPETENELKAIHGLNMLETP